jgi:hypothetical protein
MRQACSIERLDCVIVVHLNFSFYNFFLNYLIELYNWIQSSIIVILAFSNFLFSVPKWTF